MAVILESSSSHLFLFSLRIFFTWSARLERDVRLDGEVSVETIGGQGAGTVRAPVVPFFSRGYSTSGSADW